MIDNRTMRMLVKSGRAEEAYSMLVEQMIRARYTVGAELAILRQREDKPEEFAAYSEFAEACKAQAHMEVYGE